MEKSVEMYFTPCCDTERYDCAKKCFYDWYHSKSYTEEKPIHDYNVMVTRIDGSIEYYTFENGDFSQEGYGCPIEDKETIKKIVFSDDIIQLGDRSLYGLNELEEIEIGNGLKTISYRTFNCKKLKKITIKAIEAPSFNKQERPFYSLSSEGELIIPCNSDYSTWLEVLPSGWNTNCF